MAGEIGSGRDLQACVTPSLPGQTTCGVRSHVTRFKEFHQDNVYIRTPTDCNKFTVYLSPALSVSAISIDIITSLLQIERAVSYWTALLPRLPSLPFADVQKLMDILDVAVTIKSDYLTPHKTQVSSIFNNGTSVVIFIGISFGSGGW